MQKWKGCMLTNLDGLLYIEPEAEGLLIHLSPIANRQSIANLGLQPSFARNKYKRVYAGTPDRLAQIVEHVCYCHRCKPDDLDLYRLTWSPVWKRTANKWIYTSAIPVRPLTCQPLASVLTL